MDTQTDAPQAVTPPDARLARLKRVKETHFGAALLAKGALCPVATAIVFDDPAVLQMFMDLFPDKYTAQAVRETELDVYKHTKHRPLRAAMLLDSRNFVDWWRESFGPLDNTFWLLSDCHIYQNYELMRHILALPEVPEQVRDKLAARPRDVLCLFPLAKQIPPAFSDITETIVALFKSIPGYPSPDFAFEEEELWVLLAANGQEAIVDKHLGLICPTLQDHERWFGSFFDYLHHHETMIALGTAFLRLLRARTLSDSDRLQIVAHYETLIESRLKNPEVFFYLTRNNFYQPSERLLLGLLDVSPPFGYDEESDYHEEEMHDPDTRLALYYSFVFGLQHLPSPPRSYLLAKALSLVGKGAMLEGLSGLVRTLVYHGADPHAYVVKQTFREMTNGNNRYRGFASDIRVARCFLRWGERQLLGGLPREILEMIMYSAWEPTEIEDE